MWEDAHKLALRVYEFTHAFPEKEIFGMISQIRRSSSSVGVNIAEGFGRFHHAEKIHFYHIARGSILETQNHILLCRDLIYLSKEDAQKLFDDYEQLKISLNAFINTTKDSKNS